MTDAAAQGYEARLSACPACDVAPLAGRIGRPDPVRGDIMLSVPAVHCAACIVDVERTLQATPGVEFSVSIGIAATPRGGSVEDWLALADRALYHAKRQGKNTASYGE